MALTTSEGKRIELSGMASSVELKNEPLFEDFESWNSLHETFKYKAKDKMTATVNWNGAGYTYREIDALAPEPVEKKDAIIVKFLNEDNEFYEARDGEKLSFEIVSEMVYIYAMVTINGYNERSLVKVVSGNWVSVSNERS